MRRSTMMQGDSRQEFERNANLDHEYWSILIIEKWFKFERINRINEAEYEWSEERWILKKHIRANKSSNSAMGAMELIWKRRRGV